MKVFYISKSVGAQSGLKEYLVFKKKKFKICKPLANNKISLSREKNKTPENQ